MSATRFLGLIFVLVLICDKGRAELATLDEEQDQTDAASENTFSIQIPLGSGNVIQADNEVTPTAERRLSLEDFFMNKPQQQQQVQQPATPQQVPLTQFQVQQPDPNSIMLVRDAQFPSSSGGLISRLLMARRMLRLRRIARRLTLIPRMLGMGLGRSLQRSASPLSIFAKRIGDEYNPRDYVFGNSGFGYKNNSTSDTQQPQQHQRGTSTDQLQQQTRGFQVENDPYYDSNYDSLDNSNYDSDELNQMKKQEDILNSLTDEQQVLLLQQLQNYQQQLNQVQKQLNTPNSNNIQNYQNQGQNYQNQEQNYQNQGQNYQNVQPNQYQQVQNDQYNQFRQIQNEDLSQVPNDQQMGQIRQLQQQLFREQQLQQQLQQLQLSQQAQNLKQHQNLAAIDQENNYQDQNQQQQLAHSNTQHPENNAVGDRTEGSLYPSAIGIGGSAKGGNAVGIGVGIDVGLKPPGIDIQLTKPVGPIINPIVNPIIHKPPPVAPVVEPLVPLGIFPKPMLNLKGRLFFGAEMGKGVGVQAGVGR